MTIQRFTFYSVFLIINLIFTQDCDPGYSYYADIETEYNNITIQDDGTCFNDGDLEFLTELNNINNLGYESALDIGTQTWNYGKLKVFVATYAPNGAGINTVELQILPDSISNLTELITLYLEWNHLTSLPDSFTELNQLKNLYISNNRIEVLNSDFGNLSKNRQK